MICPSSMLQTKYFRELFGNTIQIIVPSRRLQFVKLIDGKIPHNYKSNCNFDTFYYCYKMNLKRDLIFLWFWLKDNLAQLSRMDFEIDYKERYVNMRNRYNELKNKMNIGVGCDKFKILFSSQLGQKIFNVLFNNY